MDTKTTTNTNYIYPTSTQYPTPKPAEYYPNIQPSQTPQYIHAPPQQESYELNYKDKPQSNSVGAAALIFTTGGMSMAWSLITNLFVPLNVDYSTYIQVCWFLMAIVGALCSAALTNLVQKRILMYMSAILTLLGGILCVALYDNYAGMMVARHINGFAVGWLFVPVLVMAGEESVKEWRGVLTSSIDALCFSLGMLLQIIFSTLWTDDFNSKFHVNQMHGTLIIFCSALSLIFIYFLVIESPVYHLLRNEEHTAIDCLRRLQRPFVVTNQTYAQLEELKCYIAENKATSVMQRAIDSLPALLKLCFYRCMAAMSISWHMSGALIYTTVFSQSNAGGVTKWPLIVYAVCRFMGVFTGVCMQDHAGRKKPLIFSMLIAAGMATGMGVLFDDNRNLLKPSKMETALILLLIYQFFASICLTSASTYLTEAFPLTIKPYWIAVTFSIEMLVHIICFAVEPNWYSLANYFYTLGALSFLFVVFGILCFPETRRVTLREAQAKFKGIIGVGFN